MGVKQLIHHEDFLTADIRVRFRNIVSGTLVDSKVKTVGDISIKQLSKSNLIQFLEILPDGLTLSVPKYICATGHTLELEVNVTNLSESPITLYVLGYVKDVEKTSEDQERVVIELKNSSDEAWKKFCQLLKKRQDAIDEFFKGVRGY